MTREIIRASVSAMVAVMLFAAPASAQMRPEVGKPLDQARKLFNADDYKGAKAWVDKAAAVPNKTPEEMKVISLFKLAIKGRSNPHHSPRA
jgi:hypothetical protein